MFIQTHKTASPHTWPLILITWLIATLTFLPTIHATPANSTGAGFTVSAKLPDNQIDPTQSYFDLRVKPDTAQPLTVIVANTSDRARQLTVSPTNAWTGDNGQVSYRPNKTRQPQAPTFTSMTSAGVTFQLAAHEAKPVTFVTRIPKTGITGQVLGAIYVTDRNTTQTTAGKSFRINNRYAMALGVNLQQTDVNKTKPDLKLHRVHATISDKKPLVVANLVNPQPVLFGGLSLTSRIFHQGGQKSLYTNTYKHYAMAPQTAMNVMMPITQKKLAPGHYTFKLTAKSGQRVWHLARNFTITQQTAQKVNRHITVKRNWSWLYIILGVVAAALLVMLGYLFGHKRQSPQK